MRSFARAAVFVLLLNINAMGGDGFQVHSCFNTAKRALCEKQKRQRVVLLMHQKFRNGTRCKGAEMCKSSSVASSDSTTTTITTATTTSLKSQSNKQVFDGGVAGSEADPLARWDDASMSGPLGRTADRIFMKLFRKKLAASILRLESDYPEGYDGMMDIVKEILETSLSSDEAVAKSLTTLRSLFPDWPPFSPPDKVGLLYWFELLFAKPFPAFSAKLNSWVTWWAAQWLMGPCEIEDLVGEGVNEDARVGDGKGQLMKVRRCRYLEEGGCASLCVNTCKLPTQKFFNEDMGVPMRMIPDYSTFECRFEFGLAPTEDDEEEAKSVSCFAQCTSKKKRKETTLTCGAMKGDLKKMSNNNYKKL